MMSFWMYLLPKSPMIQENQWERSRAVLGCPTQQSWLPLPLLAWGSNPTFSMSGTSWHWQQWPTMCSRWRSSSAAFTKCHHQLFGSSQTRYSRQLTKSTTAGLTGSLPSPQKMCLRCSNQSTLCPACSLAWSPATDASTEFSVWLPCSLKIGTKEYIKLPKIHVRPWLEAN